MELQKEELDKELCQTFKRFYAETSALGGKQTIL